MRSLVITPTPTHPTDQGNRARVAQIATALRRRGPVEILYWAIDGHDRASLDAMAAAWDGVHVVPPLGFAPHRHAPGHWGVDEWVAPHLIQAATALAAATHYDVVVVNYVWCSLLLRCFADAATWRVLDTHDVFAHRRDRAEAAGVPAHWFHTTPAEEARGLDRANIVLAIQPDEAADFRARTAAQVETIEFAMPPRAQAWPERRGAAVVGYFGSGNPWNVASLAAFDRLLAARGDLGEARFLLLGGITAAVDGLRVFQSAGRVDAPADAYSAVDLIVNPMVGGTGLKIKTVEALAHGRAVLSTADGGAGLASCGPDVRLADPAALAARLAEVLRAPAGIEAVAQAQAPLYAAFEADVARRLDGLVEMWAAGRA